MSVILRLFSLHMRETAVFALSV